MNDLVAMSGLSNIVARQIRDLATNASPTPGNWMANQVPDEMGRLQSRSGKSYEGEIPTTGPLPVTSKEDANDSHISTTEQWVEETLKSRIKPKRHIPGMVIGDD